MAQQDAIPPVKGDLITAAPRGFRWKTLVNYVRVPLKRSASNQSENILAFAPQP
jgi:hypothetical protein